MRPPKVGNSTHSAEELRELLPGATDAECIRFLECFPKKSEALEKLEGYLEWRKAMNLDDDLSSDDSQRKGLTWDECMEKAAAYTGEGKAAHCKEDADAGTAICDGNSDSSSIFYGHPVLYQLPDLTEPDESVKDNEGLPVYYHCPGRLDFSLGYTAKTFANAYALFGVSRFPRNSDQEFTLVIDVRAGCGWPNPDGLRMYGFIREVMQTMTNIMSGRCHRTIVFGLPRLVVSFFRSFVKPFCGHFMLDMVPGSHGENSPVPDGMLKFVSQDVIDLLEEARMSVWGYGVDYE